MSFTIRSIENDHESVHEAVLDSLIAFNDAKVGESGYRPIAFAIEDDSGQMTGGLSGATAYGWLFIELLFVPEPLRGQGIGTACCAGRKRRPWRADSTSVLGTPASAN